MRGSSRLDALEAARGLRLGVLGVLGVLAVFGLGCQASESGLGLQSKEPWPEVQIGPESVADLDAHPAIDTDVLVVQEDGRILVFGLEGSVWTRQLTLQVNATSARWSSDGAQIFGGGRDGVLRAWDRSGQLLWENGPEPRRGAILDLDVRGDLVAALFQNRAAGLWVGSSGESAAAPWDVGEYLADDCAMALSPDATKVAVAGHRGRVNVWNIDGSLDRTAIRHENLTYLAKVGFLADGRVFVRDWYGKLQLETGKAEEPRLLLSDGVQGFRPGGALALTDGTLLASDGEHRLWRWDFGADPEAGAEPLAEGVQILDVTKSGALWSLELEHNGVYEELKGLRLADAISRTAEQALTDATRSRARPELWLASRNPVHRLVARPDGEWLVAAEEHLLKARPDEGRLRRTAWPESFTPHDLATTPDGRWLASSGAYAVFLWQTDRPEPVLKRGGDLVSTVKFTRDRQYFVSHHGDRIEIWRLPSATSADAGFQALAYEVYGQTFDLSPDDKTLAAFTWDGRVQLFDLGGDPLTRPWGEESENLHRVAWSPESSTFPEGVIAASRDELGDLLLYRPDGTLLSDLDDRFQHITWIAFDDEGRRMAVADDRGIELFDVGESGAQPVGLLPAPQSVQVGFLEDRLWSLGSQGHVLIWNLELHLVQQVIFRDGMLILERGKVSGPGPMAR